MADLKEIRQVCVCFLNVLLWNVHCVNYIYYRAYYWSLDHADSSVGLCDPKGPRLIVIDYKFPAVVAEVAS